MRRNLIISSITLAAALLAVSPVLADKRKDGNRDQHPEQSIPATETVTVGLCVTSGDIVVRGWDRKEVRARARDASQIELRRGGTDSSGPASQISVLLTGSGTAYRTGWANCQVFGDVDLDVPRGATVQLRTGDGDVRVSAVARAFVETHSGEVEITDVSKTLEAGSLDGTIRANNCSGRARLHSVSGDIHAVNMRATEGEEFSANTVSGDISLERIGHQSVTAKTATGGIMLKGPLAKGGRYNLGTIAGDIILRLPPDASFELTAKVSVQGEIVTDFPIAPKESAPKPASPPVPRGGPRIVVSDPGTRKVSGIHGTGDANISLSSFSGTLALRKE